MSFLIDTDVLSAHLRGDRAVGTKVVQYAGRLLLSTVTVAEAKSWLYRTTTPKRFLEAYLLMESDCEVLSVDADVAETAGKIAADVKDVGFTIGTPDLLIAATAIVHDLTLVTHNLRDFTRVNGLRLADWIAS